MQDSERGRGNRIPEELVRSVTRVEDYRGQLNQLAQKMKVRIENHALF